MIFTAPIFVWCVFQHRFAANALNSFTFWRKVPDRSNQSRNRMSLDLEPPKRRIEWKVRPATPADAEAVDNLLRDSYENLLKANYNEDILKLALPKITKAREELLTCGTWYVVEDPEDGSLAGCGGWSLQSPAQAEDKVFAHLRHFGTRSDMTRKGIGQAIWKQSWEDITKLSRDGTKTTLEVLSSLTAEPFYASCGFQKIKECTLPLSPECKFPCVLMRRDPCQLEERKDPE